MLFLSYKYTALAVLCSIGLSISSLCTEEAKANFIKNKESTARHSSLENNSVLIQNKGGNKSDLIEDLNIIERARLKSMQKEFEQGILSLEKEYARKEAIYKALLRSSSATANEVGKLSLELQELEKEIINKNKAFRAEIINKFN